MSDKLVLDIDVYEKRLGACLESWEVTIGHEDSDFLLVIGAGSTKRDALIQAVRTLGDQLDALVKLALASIDDEEAPCG